jgi:hypothetical protein
MAFSFFFFHGNTQTVKAKKPLKKVLDWGSAPSFSIPAFQAHKAFGYIKTSAGGVAIQASNLEPLRNACLSIQFVILIPAIKIGAAFAHFSIFQNVVSTTRFSPGRNGYAANMIGLALRKTTRKNKITGSACRLAIAPIVRARIIPAFSAIRFAIQTVFGSITQTVSARTRFSFPTRTAASRTACSGTAFSSARGATTGSAFTTTIAGSVSVVFTIASLVSLSGIAGTNSGFSCCWIVLKNALPQRLAFTVLRWHANKKHGQ